MAMKPVEHYQQADRYLEEARTIAAKELGEDPEADPVDVAEIVGPFYGIALAHLKAAEIGLRVQEMIGNNPRSVGGEDDQQEWIYAIGFDAL